MQIRINKYLSDCGIASRRKVEELVLQGRVMINNKFIVFLPPIGGDSSFYWSKQEEFFKLKGYDTLSVDFDSEKSNVSISDLSEVVRCSILDSKYDSAHIVGLSLGGVVAIEFYSKYRFMVLSLTLCNTFIYNPDGKEIFSRIETEINSSSLLNFSKLTMPNLFCEETDRSIVESMIKIESLKDKSSYLLKFNALLHADMRNLAKDIDVPVLLIGGKFDKTTSTDPFMTDMHKVICSSTLINIDDASHFSNLDSPVSFNCILNCFIDRIFDTYQNSISNIDYLSNYITISGTTVSSQIMQIMNNRGIDFLFSNSGTDFTPIIDSIAELRKDDNFKMRIIAVPHENTAISIAHGYALLSGKPQAVMAHVNVGTANMGLGLINARRAHVPMIVLAGRTPWYEDGIDGSRSNFVQWGQESYDQGACFREYTKWDFELRSEHKLDLIIDRAISISTSMPNGPVYITLPKEVLCKTVNSIDIPREIIQKPNILGGGDEKSIEEAIKLIKIAKNPLIITADLGRYKGGPEELIKFSFISGIGVVEYGKRNFFNFPTEHKHHLGFDPHLYIDTVDLVLSIECPVPWVTNIKKPNNNLKVIQIGADPLYNDLPLRGLDLIFLLL